MKNKNKLLELEVKNRKKLFKFTKNQRGQNITKAKDE